MTVCIAAACVDKSTDTNTLVFCTDRRAGGVLGSAEVALKEIPIVEGWCMLTAGDEPDIAALIRLYRQRFAVKGACKFENLDESIKWPLYERKRHLAEHYCQTTFGISHNEFIAHGKERLPTEVFRDGLQKIAALDLKADVVVCGFLDNHPEIYHCDNRARVSATEDYSVIGSGEYIAHAALLRRGQHAVISLEQTLFNVYEAKKLSEAVGTVGPATSITILRPEKSYTQLVSTNIIQQLERLYQAFGPRQVPQNLRFEGALYDEKFAQAKNIEFRNTE